MNKDNLNNVTEKFNRIVYDYFHDNYGIAKKGFEKENELQVKYKDYSKSQLKKELKRLKHNNTDTDVASIRFVAKLLRSKVNSENTNCFKDKMNSIDHDKEIKKNFWGYVKEFSKKPNQILSNFNREICTNYFSKILRTTRPLRSYVIPEWIPKFSRPTIDFRREPPSYQEIAKIIRKMKASGSPCPLDQVSVICLKRCPYLRTYLTAIVVEIWKSGHMPVTWKKAVSILIHKKGDSDKPENFAPLLWNPFYLKFSLSSLEIGSMDSYKKTTTSNAKSKKVLYRDYLAPLNTLTI